MNATNTDPDNPTLWQKGLWFQPPFANCLHTAEASLP
jgi:hypothetical protein